MADPDDLVIIYSAAHVPDAHMVKNLLERKEISAHVSEEIEPLPGLNIDSPRVFVHQRDAARARAIIEEFEGRQIERADRPDWICPQCQANVVGAFDECDVCGRFRPGSEEAEEEDQTE